MKNLARLLLLIVFLQGSAGAQGAYGFSGSKSPDECRLYQNDLKKFEACLFGDSPSSSVAPVGNTINSGRSRSPDECRHLSSDLNKFQSCLFGEQPVTSVSNTPIYDPNKAEIDRLVAEIENQRRRRQELEAQLASNQSQSATTTTSNTVAALPTATKAFALVVGNAAYPGAGRLANPVNDATAISQKLRSMGFAVTTVTDANRQRLVQSMTQFRRAAATADISLFYYSGHGIQIFGTNYILPTDIDQTDPAQATIQGVSLNSVVETFMPGKTKLVFLDACRDNPLQRSTDRSVSRGLAPISVAQGTLISYATKDGHTASDGVGLNSPFTEALLKHLSDPQDIAVVLRKVREQVMRLTGGKQQPWEYGSLTGGELILSQLKPSR